MEHIIDSITCPITRDIIEDPVVVPCCGKSVSRMALAEALDVSARCPLCRADLSNFDVHSAPPNRALIAIIDSLGGNQIQQLDPTAPQQIPIQEKEKQAKEHQWSGTLEWLNPMKHSIGRLTLRIERSHFSTKKSLFVAVVDNSGSMAGSPWEQVQTALVHILGLTSVKSESVETRIIVYNSTAQLLPPMRDPSELDESIKRVKEIRAGGGTCFLSAYQTLFHLLDMVKDRAGEISSVSVAFLTDGQADDDKKILTQALSKIFEPYKDLFRVIVHSIGFSSGCDKQLLEQMRTAGTSEGTFRYAEPGDDSDALCGKLTDLFSISERAATAPIQVHLPDGLKFVTEKNGRFIHVEPFTRTGSLEEWIVTTLPDPVDEFICSIDSPEDQNTQVKIVQTQSAADLHQLWLRKVLDGMAAELMALNAEREKMTPQILQLQVALFLSRLKTIHSHIDDPRIGALTAQAEVIKRGGAVNEGKLADMRFASMFSPDAPKARSNKSSSSTAAVVPQAPQQTQIVYYEPEVRYKYNHIGLDRNDVQKAIMDAWPHRKNPAAEEAVQNATSSDILHEDADGNNALHLAAYCGNDTIIGLIVSKFPIDVNQTNKFNETPLTLAIKRRGFHDSLEILTGSGGILDEHRVTPLKQFCIAHGFVRTAEAISNLSTSSDGGKIDCSSSASYLQFQWDSAVKRGNPRPADQWLQPALAKCLISIVKELVQNLNGFEIPWQWFIDYCFPPKIDHPQVEQYVELSTIILDAQPSLLSGHDPESGDTTLIAAVQCGNLPIVQLVLDRGVPIDEVNDLGNNALWVACAKRYPCIVTELISRGSDVNLPNKKGNRPLSAVCQMGPAKVGQLLIAAGAEVTYFNQNGDTPLLLACRNGQADVVELLLTYCDMDFVLFRAHIDGFDALFASVEADRPECLKLIHEYGVSIEERTAKDNAILQDATPLHLAAYYGRHPSAALLLQLGADPNSKDINGMTPLHTAVLRKHMPIVELLITHKADPFAVDNMGNSAAAFSRDPNVLALLVNPVSDPLHQICSSKIRASEVREILLGKSAVPGINEPRDILEEAKNQKGMTALSTAIIHSNFELVELLIKDIGFDPCVPDTRGLTPQFWAQWIRNPRILKLLNLPNNQETPQLQRLRAASRSPDSMAILFLSDPQPFVPKHSSFAARLDLINLMTTTFDSQFDSRRQLVFDSKSADPTTVYEQKASKQQQTEFQKKFLDISRDSLWQAKIEAVSSIASSCNENLSAAQLVALFLYSCDRTLVEVLSYYLCGKSSPAESVPIFPMVKCLWTALEQLPPFQAEVYSASIAVDRRLFAVGNTVASPSFVSATSLWPVAIDSLNFEKEGTVFIIKSNQKGRLISSHSNFPFESEVLFAPGTRFVVTKWYRGDVIALGQSNIRDHTFGLTDEQIGVIMMNKKPLIIELHEA